MGNTKALSPLVAIVLLIAFVVAFVVLIVSAISLIAGGGKTCDKVAIDIGQEGTPKVCLNEETEKLQMAVKNTGSITIGGFTITATGESGTAEEDITTELIPELSDDYTVDYPKANGALTELTIVPLLGDEEKEGCEESAVSFTGGQILRC